MQKEKAPPLTIPPKRPLRTVRALVVLDPAGAIGRTADDEFKQLLDDYRDIHDLELQAKRAENFSPHGDDAYGCDLIIFDWGGMGTGGSMLMQHQVRWLTTFAQDHPSTLIVIRSMVWAYIEREMEAERIPKLANMILDEGFLNLPDWWLKTLPDRFSDARTSLREARYRLEASRGEGVDTHDTRIECELAHDAMEEALRAILTATKTAVPDTTDMKKLIDAVEQAGERPPKTVHWARTIPDYRKAAARALKMGQAPAPASAADKEEATRIATEIVEWAEGVVDNQENGAATAADEDN